MATKKKEKKRAEFPPGWTAVEHPNGVTATKHNGDGTMREVVGQDWDDALACAQEVEQYTGSKTLTAQQAARDRASELRAEAKALEQAVA